MVNKFYQIISIVPKRKVLAIVVAVNHNVLFTSLGHGENQGDIGILCEFGRTFFVPVVKGMYYLDFLASARRDTIQWSNKVRELDCSTAPSWTPKKTSFLVSSSVMKRRIGYTYP